MNNRNKYLAIAGMSCTATGLITSVGGTWAMLHGEGWGTGAVGLACAVVMMSLAISAINSFQRDPRMGGDREP